MSVRAGRCQESCMCSLGSVSCAGEGGEGHEKRSFDAYAGCSYGGGYGSGGGVRYAAYAAVFTGRNGSDFIIGTPNRDQIDARGGKDRVNGMAGDDHIVGGLGPDRLYGADGDDTLLDGAGEFGQDRSVDIIRGGRERLCLGVQRLEGQGPGTLWRRLRPSASRQRDRSSGRGLREGPL
jgi:hypothetical protein